MARRPAAGGDDRRGGAFDAVVADREPDALDLSGELARLGELLNANAEERRRLGRAIHELNGEIVAVKEQLAEHDARPQERRNPRWRHRATCALKAKIKEQRLFRNAITRLRGESGEAHARRLALHARRRGEDPRPVPAGDGGAATDAGGVRADGRSADMGRDAAAGRSEG